MRRSFHRAGRCGVLFTLAVGLAAMLGWSAPGHRTIARLAIEAMPSDAPAWIRGTDAAQATAYAANEPDRYRSNRSPTMSHENNADHYMDVELLKDHGLTLQSLPRLRYQFVEVLVRTTPAAAPTPTNANGEAMATITPTFSPEGVGMLPYAITEHYAKLVSTMNTARIIESAKDPKMANILEQARANVRFEMGQLAHFVGDAGQPLHTTIHHHGWTGANPDGFTTDKKFHSYIDGEVVELHKLNVATMHSLMKPAPDLAGDGVWDAAIALMQRSFDALRPLYEMEKSGELRGEKGKALIAARLGDSASTLGAMYKAAWRESEPTQKQIDDFKKYDSTDVEMGWTHTTLNARPSSDPASLPKRAAASETREQPKGAEHPRTLDEDKALDVEADVPNAQTRQPAAALGSSVTAGPFESRIKSNFAGKAFDHGSLFELQDGQIWKQTEYYIYYYYAYSPRATFYHDGSVWKMKVDGIEHAITVERIK